MFYWCCLAWLMMAKESRYRNYILINQFVDPAAAAAKSLQSCPTLCDPIDGLLPGSPVPGILQARTLEWVAISFCWSYKYLLTPPLGSICWNLEPAFTVIEMTCWKECGGLWKSTHYLGSFASGSVGLLQYNIYHQLIKFKTRFFQREMMGGEL